MIKRINNYLYLNKLEPDLRVAKLLPPNIACLYHALPIANDGECITVAMADPNNVIARDAIATALGNATCIVKADGNSIDSFLNTLWLENLNLAKNFITWSPPDEADIEANTYARNFANLLGARIHHFEAQDQGKSDYPALVTDVKRIGAELVMFRPHHFSGHKRLVADPAEKTLVNLSPVSTLLIYGYRWPIKKILLVIRNEESDEVSIQWALSLAKSCGAFVTVLTITTPIPAMYTTIRNDVQSLLSADCPMGRKMRSVARRLVDWEIDGALHLRNEPPNEQIRTEAINGNHDLIIIASEPKSRIQRLFLGNLIFPILDWTDRPVLITKSHT